MMQICIQRGLEAEELQRRDGLGLSDASLLSNCLIMIRSLILRHFQLRSKAGLCFQEPGEPVKIEVLKQPYFLSPQFDFLSVESVLR
jgi:hypothetical protein